MTALLRRRRRRVPEENRRSVKVEPYTVLARYYDDVMDHVDYRGWAAHVHRIIKKHGSKPGHLVDFACGTGSLLQHLVRHGYRCTGLDGCSAMIEAARANASRFGPAIDYHVASMTEAPPVEGMDHAVCLYDSVNYLMEEDQVAHFLLNVRRLLRPGGLFVLDLSTEKNSRDHFDGYSLEEEVEGALYRRWTRYDPEQRIQHNHFEILPDEEDAIYLEHHRQRVWGVDWMIERMGERDLGLVGVYHNLTLRPGGEESDRVHIVVEPV